MTDSEFRWCSHKGGAGACHLPTNFLLLLIPGRGGAWEEPGWEGLRPAKILQSGRSALVTSLILGEYTNLPRTTMNHERHCVRHSGLNRGDIERLRTAVNRSSVIPLYGASRARRVPTPPAGDRGSSEGDAP